MWKLLPLLLLAVACTKPNPNRCCTDEADCAAAELPVGSTCAAGLVCRGNQCIAEPCGLSSECEASAPYCVAEFCAESCSEDMQCPGFGQRIEDRFCIDGACRECRSGMPDDCSSAVPICDQGTCRVCRAHDECPSGICIVNGHCVDESAVSYVEASGSTTSDCTRASPCSTVVRSLELSKTYVLIGPGTYTSSVALALSGQRHLVGANTQPVLTRSTGGPIITINSGQITLENLQVSGATRGANDGGEGIYCSATAGASAIQLRRVVVRDNVDSGLSTVSCVVAAVESTFTNNGRDAGGSGMRIVNGTAAIDRCLVINNDNGLELDSGVYQVTNSFIVRNDSSTGSSFGVNVYSTESGHKFEFNTIVDNGNSAVTGSGFNCNIEGVTVSLPNNIIARNRVQAQGSNCTYPGSIIVDTDIRGLKFKSPDTPPYDYHITAGSTAIDLATQSTNDHDFDGEPRAAPRDVGADELVP